MPWHRRVFLLSYRMFDGHPPAQADILSYWITVVGTTLYLIVAAMVFITLNIGTLVFGVFAEPIWWPAAKFRLLKFSNGLPVIPFAIAILLVWTSYSTWVLRGPLIALGGWFVVVGGALMLIAVVAAFNALRRHLNG